MFVGKPRSLSERGTPKRLYTRLGFSFTSIILGWKGLPGTNTHPY
jgi:hypothetical protein